MIFSISKLLRHRGPDWNGITCFRNCYLAHERLAINGLLSGAQVYNLSSKLSPLIQLNGDVSQHHLSFCSRSRTSTGTRRCLSMERSTIMLWVLKLFFSFTLHMWSKGTEAAAGEGPGWEGDDSTGKKHLHCHLLPKKFYQTCPSRWHSQRTVTARFSSTSTRSTGRTFSKRWWFWIFCCHRDQLDTWATFPPRFLWTACLPSFFTTPAGTNTLLPGIRWVFTIFIIIYVIVIIIITRWESFPYTSDTEATEQPGSLLSWKASKSTATILRWGHCDCHCKPAL